ncbi:hypothetical protein UPYG_G00044320 [Umbra pygmaea]|uniref:Uncharacterized protein n=1 Tax=Umbra pygmaea TaxID=75934 RepID=A0ABD0XQP3_UMBPY
MDAQCAHSGPEGDIFSAREFHGAPAYSVMREPKIWAFLEETTAMDPQIKTEAEDASMWVRLEDKACLRLQNQSQEHQSDEDQAKEKEEAVLEENEIPPQK